MGRSRKVVEDEPEVIGEADDMMEYEPVGDGRRAYIKNGVTILRDPSGESALLADGWVRK